MAGRGGRAALALAAYLVITAIYTHPLLLRSRDAIASDRYDPVLNASILWWNATTLPFSAQWWTPPHYYPSEGTAAFTENLTGLGPIATPLYLVTGDPLLTYNLTLFLTWPLSAFAVFVLATTIGVRPGAAFVGGLVFGFAPYRVAQMSHLQVLACFWLPFALACLHRYLADRRAPWLALFGLFWVLQSLSNGYFMLFGAVLIGLWLLYFCSTRETVRAVPAILAAWMVASLPLLPVLLEYKRIHDAYGLARPLGAIVAYSAQARAWIQTSNLVASWGRVLDDRGQETSLFPGVTAVAVLLAAAVAVCVRRRRTAPARPLREQRLAAAAGALAVVASLVVVYTIVAGPWRVSIAGLLFRVSSIDRPLLIAAASWLVLIVARERGATTAVRGPFLFYSLATVAIVVLCMGPEIRAGTRVVLESAPYGWLLALPGFEGLRVPTRFWMLGALCLGVAVALGLDRIAPAAPRARAFVITLLSAAVLADGWLGTMPMAPAPQQWGEVERADTGDPLIELPLGPEFDAAATYRAVRHRRRVANGVSGYDPPHYGWLMRGLAERDPNVLLALTAFGPLDVVVDGSAEGAEGLHRYVMSIPGARAGASDGARTLYRLPSTAAPPQAGGARIPVASGRASRGVVDLSAALDGNPATACILPAPQAAGEWIEVDLGRVVTVGGIGYTLGPDLGGAPRSFAIDLSTDGEAWHNVFEGRGFEHALAALMRTPRTPEIPFSFAPRSARHVRLRVRESASAPWTIADLSVYAPSVAPADGQPAR
jgi:hypothetical protein